METTTTAAARSMAGYNFVLALLGWAIFWTVLIRELCVRTRLRAAPVVASAPTPPPPPPTESEPDEEEIEQPKPAAGFTDEVMAAIMEQARAEVKLLTDPQMPAVRPAPVATTQAGVEVLCRYCWHAQAETEAEFPSYRPIADVEWKVCAHHKRAWQQARDRNVATGLFPTQVYFLDLPRPRSELN